MCGIAGEWCFQRRLGLESSVRSMTDALTHRGPNDSGAWSDEAAGIALSHRRLSILDLSPAGHQPMFSACDRYILVFNGEIYNHLELRKKIQADGFVVPTWKGHSDTETLLACFVAWGVEQTLKLIVGMFAIALWDRERQMLTLARDRMGEKPLYYGWRKGSFLFASELKALKKHPDFGAEVDRGALALLLRHNYVPAPWSIYEGIRKLSPGTFLELDVSTATNPNSQPKEKTYWSLSAVAEKGTAEPFAGSDSEALDSLDNYLGEAVRRQMLADVPLGTLLSGGIDSTIVTALMQAKSGQPVKTFTIGFDEREYDEATHARSVAQHLGTEHVELRLSGKDALALVPNMSEIYDEPFADSSQLPTYLVMQLAKQHVTVALTGDGGDELFGGYNRYFLAPKVWQYLQSVPMPLRRNLGKILTALPVGPVNRLVAPFTKRLGFAQPGDKANKLGLRLQSVDSLDDLYVSLVSEWPQAEKIVHEGWMPNNVLDRRDCWPNLEDPVLRMMAMDGLTYMPDDILVKVDRAAMAVSLETRAPFLDRDLVNFAWSLPMNMKIREGQGKWLLRNLLDRYVPRALMERPKMGFGIPLDAWLRGPLRDWAEELLNEDRLRREGYFNPAPIRATWQAHLSGKGAYGYRLWSVLMFQAWLACQ